MPFACGDLVPRDGGKVEESAVRARLLQAAKIKHVILCACLNTVAHTRARGVAVDHPAAVRCAEADAAGARGGVGDIVDLYAHRDIHRVAVTDGNALAVEIATADAKQIHTFVRRAGVVGVGAVGNGVGVVVNAVCIPVHIGNAVDLDHARGCHILLHGVVVVVITEAVSGHALVEVGGVFADHTQRVGRAAREFTGEEAVDGLKVVAAAELVVVVPRDARQEADVLKHDGLHAAGRLVADAA